MPISFVSGVAAPEPATLAVEGTQACYPVRRIFCVGQNYAAHARETGNDPDREPPVYFTKSPHCIVAGGGPVAYPPQTADLHFEGELVVALGPDASHHGGLMVDSAAARAMIWGYAAGLDLTRRDLQAAAKARRGPWDMGKDFTGAAPVGTLVQTGPQPMTDGRLTTTVNGNIRQNADLAEMILPVIDIIVDLSRYERLLPGDLLFTGTPAGVGPLVPGDRVAVQIAGLPPLEATITDG